MKKKTSKSVRNSISSFHNQKKRIKVIPFARHMKKTESKIEKPEEENFYSLKILQAFCQLVDE
jgi:hypothetical protein